MSRKYWSIKEVSELYNINSNKLRFYEKKGLIRPDRDPENGYRRYGKEDLVRIQMILTYRLLELPVERIKTLLDSHDKETIIDQVFEQLEMLNTVLHKYKCVQSSLTDIVDQYVDSDTRSDVMHNVIKAGERLGNTIGYSDWSDRWDFDSWSENYDATIKYGGQGLNLFKSYEEVLERVYVLSKESLEPFGKVLDVGVGTGALASKYLDDSVSIIGVDQSHKMLLIAKKKYPNLKLRVGDFMKLPFESNSFERVVSTYAFHHLDDTEKEYALRELIRVLKPNGELLIGDMMFADSASRDAFLCALSEDDREAVEDEYYTNIELFSTVIEKYDLQYSVEKLDELMHILRIRNTH